MRFVFMISFDFLFYGLIGFRCFRIEKTPETKAVLLFIHYGLLSALNITYHTAAK